MMHEVMKRGIMIQNDIERATYLHPMSDLTLQAGRITLIANESIRMGLVSGSY